MDNIHSLTLGEIVSANYKAAAVLEKYAIDFCCNGHRKIEEACQAVNIDPSLIIHELRQLNGEVKDSNFDDLSLQRLIDHILARHHAYIEERCPKIKKYLDKICAVHGTRHPELLEVRSIFFEVSGELTVHMKKEEIMLFPFIRRLEQAQHSGVVVQSPLYNSVSSPIERMMSDHAEEGDKLRGIASLTDNYSAPDDACATFAVTYQLLKEFEQDLHIHIHLENNILFPKAIALEKGLREIAN